MNLEHDPVQPDLDHCPEEKRRRTATVGTTAVSQIQHRYETALRAAQVYIFCQNADLRYTWVYSPEGAPSQWP